MVSTILRKEETMSTCVKCGSHLFKVQRTEPHGSAYVLYFVQCTSCGVPVGVLEAENVGAKLDILERKINQLSGELSNISHQISSLQNQHR